MSDDVPSLLPSATQLWQTAQTINTLSALAARVRGHREREGRLAFADDQHAAYLHEARRFPPVRAMTTAEQEEWTRRTPADLAARQFADEPVSVWTAQVVDEQGNPTGAWGVEAHAWDEDGTPVATAFLVCRDPSDAVTLARHLRERGTAADIDDLHRLATAEPGQFVVAGGSSARLGQPAAPAAELTEDAWEAALRQQLPQHIADRVVARDPSHPHHLAWRELHRLAQQEHRRIGADPVHLAALVRDVPHWSDSVANPPALAHWALVQARTSPAYTSVVAAPGSAPTAASTGRPVEHPNRVRLVDIRSHHDALQWARRLESRNPAHHLEAKAGFGHWGSDVDAILATRFPTVTRQTAAAVRERRRIGAARIAAHRGEPGGDTAPVTLDELAREVDRLDPAKPIDRRAALIMLGRVPTEIDGRIANRFADVPEIVERLEMLYPEGLADADAEASVWRNRADGAEAQAGAVGQVPDNPVTPPREDIDATSDAADDRGLAVAQRGIAHTVATAPPDLVRRTVGTQPNPRPASGR